MKTRPFGGAFLRSAFVLVSSAGAKLLLSEIKDGILRFTDTGEGIAAAAEYTVYGLFCLLILFPALSWSFECALSGESSGEMIPFAAPRAIYARRLLCSLSFAAYLFIPAGAAFITVRLAAGAAQRLSDSGLPLSAAVLSVCGLTFALLFFAAVQRMLAPMSLLLPLCAVYGTLPVRVLRRAARLLAKAGTRFTGAYGTLIPVLTAAALLLGGLPLFILLPLFTRLLALRAQKLFVPGKTENQ